ncbi:MAG: hypothetical protein AB7T63_06140 [Planctomycetota bacterium]
MAGTGPLRGRGRSPRAALDRLAALRLVFGADAADRKREALDVLASTALLRPDDVVHLHELLLFVRAYPDDADILERAESMLQAFAQRRDLVRFRDRLVDSGIAGTAIHYAFFYYTARRLARRYPGRLHIEWDELESDATIADRMWLLMPYAEELALAKLDLTAREQVTMLKGAQETDAEFLFARFDAWDVEPFTKEKLVDDLVVPLRLESGPETPSRTKARVPVRRVHYQTEPLDLSRPDLAQVLREPPDFVRDVRGREAEALVEMSRDAMVTRSRDLDAFLHADAADVRRIGWNDGLELVALGLVPERRMLLETLYGFITVKNGVPIGYVLATAWNASSEIMYNVFEANRGAEAARIYGRILSAVHQLLGSTAFTVDPYQLGHDNSEGQASGAWWFYRKLGFESLDPEVQRVERAERRRMKAKPGHRSTPATLQALSAENMYWFADGRRDDVIGLFDLTNVSVGAARHLARRFGSDCERGLATLVEEASALLGVHAFRGWSAGERQAFERWAPIVTALPGIRRWSLEARRELGAIVRAKGGRRESEFTLRLNRHAQARRALLAFSEEDHGG